MGRLLTSTATSTAVLFTSTTGAFAACESFVATSSADQREAYHKDLGEPGPGVGDKLVGSRVVNNEDGNPIGTANWISHVNSSSDAGISDSRDLNVIFVLNDGTLFAIAGPDHPHEHATHGDVGALAPTTAITADIVGGTQAFARASGTVALEGDGNEVTYRFDMACD